MQQKRSFQEQVSRNRRKFFMKYGFDLIEYVNLVAVGSSDEEVIAGLHISPVQLEHFRKDLKSKKVESKAIL